MRAEQCVRAQISVVEFKRACCIGKDTERTLEETIPIYLHQGAVTLHSFSCIPWYRSDQKIKSHLLKYLG